MTHGKEKWIYGDGFRCLATKFIQVLKKKFRLLLAVLAGFGCLRTALTQSNLTNPPAGMVLVPAGTFMMGDKFNDPNPEGDKIKEMNGYPEKDETPTHSVYVSAFYMDKYDVTLSLWTNTYRWATNHGYSFDNPGMGKAANYPVYDLDWYDCVKWCNARSEMEGRTPAYFTSEKLTTVYRSGDLDLSNSWVNWTSGYRLPTEAEWEKAARGGLSGRRFPWGDEITESQANYCSMGSNNQAYDLSYPGHNPGFASDGWTYPYSRTSPVDAFPPNGYGLCDMAGNVFQWCWDWFGDYSSASEVNPHGPGECKYGSDRIDRGGSCETSALSCRVAFRDYSGPKGNGPSFRSVLPSPAMGENHSQRERGS
jgi:formylglycine-generating enzyme